MDLHLRIITAVRLQHDKAPKPAGSIIDDYTNEELIRIIFANFRGGTYNRRGLRLTNGGLAIMQSYFTVYKVCFNPVPVYNARHILYLDRICRMPWCIDNEGSLWTMEAELAMRAKLVGNLDTLVSAFSS
jgi:hypothetical protein